VFRKVYCKTHWAVIIDDNIIKDIRKYIFERFNFENLPLRMVCLTRAYKESNERNYLTVLRSLISHEEFISETKERMLGWLSEMGPLHQADKQILTHLLKTSLCYEDYDKFVSQDGGAWFGEGWNGSYRIYNNKGSYITVSFDCYCHPGNEREHLKLSYRRYKESLMHQIISADAREDETSYIYDSKSAHELRTHLELVNVSLTNLFCFLLFSMGSLLDFYRFRCLATEQFSVFWQDLEQFEFGKKRQDVNNIGADDPNDNENNANPVHPVEDDQLVLGSE